MDVVTDGKDVGGAYAEIQRTVFRYQAAWKFIGKCKKCLELSQTVVAPARRTGARPAR